VKIATLLRIIVGITVENFWSNFFSAKNPEIYEAIAMPTRYPPVAPVKCEIPWVA
jgi:hypothetical protein